MAARAPLNQIGHITFPSGKRCDENHCFTVTKSRNACSACLVSTRYYETKHWNSGRI